jgi:hypothetical protein
MEPENKNKGGRPKLEIDPELVYKLAVIHCSPKEIAQIVGCSADTIRGRFSDILAKGRAEGKQSLRRKQMEVAMSGNTSMLIWLGKNILGQSDTPISEEDLSKILPWSDDAT